MDSFEKFIIEKAALISFSQAELSNIASTLSTLKDIINSEPDFKEPFLGGSYKRATMVKSISDVDVYFRYMGNGSPQLALQKLKTCLVARYPNTTIRQDKPSILAEFNKIPINVTPFKENALGVLGIPDEQLMSWKAIEFGTLEKAITMLRQKDSRFIDLIKVLKLWNRNNNKDLRNFQIEIKACSLFLNSTSVSRALPDWLWTYYNSIGFNSEASKIFAMRLQKNEAILKTDWLNFIDKG